LSFDYFLALLKMLYWQRIQPLLKMLSRKGWIFGRKGNVEFQWNGILLLFDFFANWKPNERLKSIDRADLSEEALDSTRFFLVSRPWFLRSLFW
jgi:hypothetical protein